MKFKTYVIFFVLFGVLPDTYLCMTVLPAAPLAGRLALCIPTLVILACLPLIGAGVRYTDTVRVFSYVSFLFQLPKAVMALFSIVGRFVLGLSPATADWIAFGFGAGVSLLFFVLIFYMTRHLKVQSDDLSFAQLPLPFDGLRICQMSDLHLGSFGKRARYVRRIVDTVLAHEPDVIFFTGDLVNFSSTEADSYLGELARLQAPLGIFAIRGNHDYLLHGHHSGEARVRDMDRLLAAERGLGWNILLNENVVLEKDGASLAVVGVENYSSNPFFRQYQGDLKAALEGLPDGIFKILLSHDPSHWRAEVVSESDIALTLSGHTHGLKYKLAGLHPSHWKLPESSGVYRLRDRVLHVSEGLGSAFAFRLGGFPKIDLISLHRKPE